MDPILGQIQTFGFNFAPRGWAFCDGQLLSIAQNTALFSLLGTTYGGDGRTTFALPNLKGRSIVHPGTGPGLSPINWGQTGGRDFTTLTIANMPPHSHQLIQGQSIVETIVKTSSGSPINESDNGTNPLGTGGAFPDIYSDSISGNDKVGGVTSTISGTTAIAGSGMSFDSRNPFLGMYTCIAMQGIFPSRN